MPYVYAIYEEVYEDGIPPKPDEYKYATLVFHDVPEQIAESHPNGRWKLVTHTGENLTDWNSFFSDYIATDRTVTGTGKPLTDALGQQLTFGDFVMTSMNGRPELSLFEVISFTPQRIKLREIRSFGSGFVKKPLDVIKVDKSLFF